MIGRTGKLALSAPAVDRGRLRQVPADKPLLQQALALSLLVVIAGCHDSAKNTQATPSPTTKPQATPSSAAAKPVVAAVPAKPFPSAPPPSLDTMVPVKTFEIQLPAALGADQLPEDQAVEFHFAGKAGQMLSVQANELGRVRVHPPGGGSPLSPGWDEAGNWLFGLPKTGSYSVLYAPWKTTPHIQFGFLSPDDPKSDPGVNREDVSVDFGELAPGQQLTLAPFAIDEEGELFWESWPTHLATVQRDFEFRIMTVAGNKGVFKKYERMTALEAMLQTKGKNATPKKLPYPVFQDGGLNLWTKPEFMEGDGWNGLRWIGVFAQDSACGPDMGGQELGYYFEGISNDGRYFILLRARISSSALAGRFERDCAAAEAEFRNADLNAVFRKDMVGADPGSFQPNLDQLDAVIQSLKLQPSTSGGGNGGK